MARHDREKRRRRALQQEQRGGLLDLPSVLPPPDVVPEVPTFPVPETPAPAPPAEPAPTVPAGDKVARAVAFINARAAAIAAEIFMIGDYLLREFFDGDARAVGERRPDKMNSFRDLAARDDLVVGYVTLWRAVQLAVQEGQLAIVSSMKQLTPSHKIALLPIRDLAEKRELARQAAEEGWSVKRLQQEVRRRRAPAPGGGDQGLAVMLRCLRQVARSGARGVLAPEALDDIPRARLRRLAPLMRSAHETLGRSLSVADRLLSQ